MKIEIELTAEELKLMRSFCILRPIKRAVDLLEKANDESKEMFEGFDIEDTIDDLNFFAPTFEAVRMKIVQASWTEAK